MAFHSKLMPSAGAAALVKTMVAELQLEGLL